MKPEYIYLVGYSDAEATNVMSVHKSYDEALATWNAIRIGLIWQRQIFQATCIADGDVSGYYDHNADEIDSLLCEDPEKINNYPCDCPFIQRMELKE